MTLRNLLKIGRLTDHEADADQVRRLLASARRSVSDAREESISSETRLDAAYRAIMQAATVALWANGYRPSKSAPGHHMTIIQSLTHSIGLDNQQMLVLDSFRVKRNAIDYLGEYVDPVSVELCIQAADELIEHVSSWLSENRPDLIGR